MVFRDHPDQKNDVTTKFNIFFLLMIEDNIVLKIWYKYCICEWIRDQFNITNIYTIVLLFDFIKIKIEFYQYRQ